MDNGLYPLEGLYVGGLFLGDKTLYIHFSSSADHDFFFFFYLLWSGVSF